MLHKITDFTDMLYGIGKHWESYTYTEPKLLKAHWILLQNARDQTGLN